MEFSDLVACFAFRHLAVRILLVSLMAVSGLSQTSNQENHSVSPRDDASAATIHGSPGSPEARSWQILQQGLAEKSMHVRLMAINALGSIGPNSLAIKLAERGLSDEEPEIRKAAATALGEMKAQAAIPQLRTALDDPAPEVGLAAAEALWRIGDRRVRRVLLDVLAGNRPVSEGLLKKQTRDARRKLHDPKGLAILGAKEGAGRLLGPMSFVVPLSKEVVGDKGVSPRATTAMLLATDHDPQSVKALEEALVDKDWSVRSASAKALGDIGRPEFVSVLEPALLDAKPEVRFAAAASIIRIKTKGGDESQSATPSRIGRK
jgi:HEAT repeat protein